jgi:hypothetical protein
VWEQRSGCLEITFHKPHNVCEVPALGMPFFTQSLTPFSSSYDLLAATTLASTTGIIRINYDNGILVEEAFCGCSFRWLIQLRDRLEFEFIVFWRSVGIADSI